MKRSIYAANEDIQDKHFPIEKEREEKKTKFRATEEESAHVVELKGIAGRFLRI